MNADLLLAHYHRIADAPDAIPRLRRFILDLAVRGKLAPQDPNDEPASELLKRMAEGKARLVKAGEIRKNKPIPELVAADLSFEMPRGWKWVRLEHLAQKITDGEHLSPSKTTSGMPLLTAVHVSARGLTLNNPQFVSIEDGQRFRLRCDPQRGDILICSRGTIGRCVVVDVDDVFCLMGSVIQVRLPKECSQRYFNYFLSTDRAQRQMRGMSGATAVQALYLKDIRLCPLPLPPIAEQHRIVAKVDELMALCDRFETARAEREAARDRLAAASLARLNAPDPDPVAFSDDGRFALTNLAALTTRPDQVKQLRQTILNLAVRGKLVPQDPRDELAGDLLVRTDSRSGSEQAARFDPLDASNGYDEAFMLPPGWIWVRLEEVAQIGTGLTPSKSELSYYKDGNIPWINSGATSAEVIDAAKFFVTAKAVKECRLKSTLGEVWLLLSTAKARREGRSGF